MRPASLIIAVLLLGACAPQQPVSAPAPVVDPAEQAVGTPAAPAIQNPPLPAPGAELPDYPRRPGSPEPRPTESEPAPAASEPRAFPRKVAPVVPREFDAEIEEFESADKRDPKTPGGVVFVGSSTIRLWPMLEEDFPRAYIVHRGFGGSQLDDVIHYAPRIVLPYRPRLIVLYAGDNDLNAGKSPTAVFRDFQAFVALVWKRLPRTRIAFVSIKPSGARWALAGKMRETNAMIRRYVASDPRLLYVDVFNPMLGPEGQPRTELFVADRLHLSVKGYALWREILRPIVELK